MTSKPEHKINVLYICIFLFQTPGFTLLITVLEESRVFLLIIVLRLSRLVLETFSIMA